MAYREFDKQKYDDNFYDYILQQAFEEMLLKNKKAKNHDKK